MEQQHKFSLSIINAMKTHIKGEVNFVENHKNWVISANVKWNRKTTTLTLSARNLDLENEFKTCTISRFSFLSYLSRSETYNFSGSKSKYSELLLESVETQYLMDSKNPSIKLKGKSLMFKGEIKKKDSKSLSNLFILFESLMNKLN